MPPRCNDFMRELSQLVTVNNSYLNYEKTHAVLLHTEQKTLLGMSLRIDTNQFEEVKSLKFLSLYINEWFDWKKHYNGVIESMNSGRYLIRGLQNVLNEK